MDTLALGTQKGHPFIAHDPREGRRESSCWYTESRGGNSEKRKCLTQAS